MIEIHKTIKKSDIATLGKLKGKTNAGPVKVEGVEYGIGELCFMGFAGRVTNDRTLYSGVLRFEPATEGSAHTERCLFDFMDAPQKYKPGTVVHDTSGKRIVKATRKST